MRRLLKGISRFKENSYPQLQTEFARLANGQQPQALFITCSDSRIQPSLVTDTGPGELFVLRNAGNIVGHRQIADQGTAGTVEYAVKALKVPEIIICGHSRCGAMKGLIDPTLVDGLPELQKFIGTAREALDVQFDADSEDDRWTQVVKANIRLQLRNLLSFPVVADAVEAGELSLSGWLYNFETGDVRVLAPESDRFVEPRLLLLNL